MKENYSDIVIEEIDRVLSYLNKDDTIPYDTGVICYHLFKEIDEAYYACDSRLMKYFEILEHEGLVSFYREPRSAQINIAGQNVVRNGGFAKYIRSRSEEKVKAKEQDEQLKQRQLELTTLQIDKVREELEAKLTQQQTRFYERSVEKLDVELSHKVAAAEKRLKKAQLEFFHSSTERNKVQSWGIVLSIVLSLLSLYLHFR